MSYSPSDIANRDYSVEISQYFSRGWDIFKQFAFPFIGFFLLMALISGASSKLPYPLGLNEEGLGGIVNLVLSPILASGLFIVAFKIAKGLSPSFGDFFKGFNNFLQIFLVNVVSSILIFLGFLLLIIPGIYLAVAYFFSLAFVVEKRLDFWSALETSRKLITKKWFSFLGFSLLLFLLNVVGLLLCGIGLLVTVPLTVCIVAAAFEDIVGLNGQLNEVEDTV